MSTVFNKKSSARYDSLLIRPARARFRLGAITLTGLLAFALAIPAPYASQPGAAARAAHLSGSTTAGPLPPPIIETGCCA